MHRWMQRAEVETGIKNEKNWKLAVWSHSQTDFRFCPELSTPSATRYKSWCEGRVSTHVHVHLHVCAHVQILISSCTVWVSPKLICPADSLGKGHCSYFCFLTWAGRRRRGWLERWTVPSGREETRWEGKKRKAEEFAGFVQVHPPISNGQMRSDREITMSRPPPFRKPSPIISGSRNSSWQIFGTSYGAVTGLGRPRRGGWRGEGRASGEDRDEQSGGQWQGVGGTSCSTVSCLRHTKNCYSEKEHFINSVLSRSRAGNSWTSSFPLGRLLTLHYLTFSLTQLYVTQVPEAAIRRCEHHEPGCQPKLMKVKRGFFSTNFNWTCNQFPIQPEAFPVCTQQNEVMYHGMSGTTQGQLTWGSSLTASLPWNSPFGMHEKQVS